MVATSFNSLCNPFNAHAFFLRTPLRTLLDFKLIVFQLLIVVLFGSGVPFLDACAERTPSDFNNDGMSELVFISPQKTLLWNSFDVASGSSIDSKDVGVLGDQVIMADWLGEGKPQLGVTRVESGSKAIVWRVRDDAGLIRELHFGVSGDTVVAAADFNGNGSADAVVVRKEGRKLHWFIMFDPFNGGGTTADFIFATSKENIFYINSDGQGMRFASLITTSKVTRLKLLNPITGVRRSINNLDTERSRQGKLIVAPLQMPDGLQTIAMIRRAKKKTTVTIIDPIKRKKSRKKVLRYAMPAVGDSVVGNFLSNPGYEVAVQTNSGVVVLNPFDGSMREISSPAGILVDEFNINKLVAGVRVVPPTPTKVPGVPTSSPPSAETPEPGSPAPESLRSVCSSTSSISVGEMLIKSEASNHINNLDPRATGYTVVCGRLCPGDLDYVPFYYSNGVVAGAVGYFSTFSGNGRPRLYGASARAPQHSASEISRTAASIGNGKLYLQMGHGSCKEFNPTGRNGGI